MKKIRNNVVLWKKPNPENPGNAPDGFREVAIFCNETFGRDNWDSIGGTIYFRNTVDAMFFSLKWT